MGRIVAIGGGDFNTAQPLLEHAVSLCRKTNPSVLYIGAASNDAQAPLRRFKKVMGRMGCSVSQLALTINEMPHTLVNQMMDQADMIYIGGGNTDTLMKAFRKYNLTDKIKEIYERDSAVLSGISAGGIAMFESGYSDYLEDQFTFIDGIGICKGCYCPHYNEAGRDSFDQQIGLQLGYGIENNVAYCLDNGKAYFLKCFATSNGWLFENGVKTAVECKRV